MKIPGLAWIVIIVDSVPAGVDADLKAIDFARGRGPSNRGEDIGRLWSLLRKQRLQIRSEMGLGVL